MDIVIRPTEADEIDGLNDLERDGDRRYEGYPGVPDGFDDVVEPSVLTEARADGRLWVAAAGLLGGTEVVGFALVDRVDGAAHLAQLSVALAFQGRGIGRRLVEAVRRWARQEAMEAVTLCTFSDVDWNRPLYEHLGFAVLPERRWTPGVRALFEADAELGLDLSRRVVMWAAVAPS